MKHSELLYDSVSVERGNELLGLFVEYANMQGELHARADERNRYFVDTTRRLTDEAITQSLDNFDYTNLGRAVMDARLVQQRYDEEAEAAKDLAPTVWTGTESIRQFIRQHEGSPLAVRVRDRNGAAIHTYGGGQSRRASGFLVASMGGSGSLITNISFKSRMTSKRSHAIRVLDYRGMPQVDLAIGATGK
ncbi:MAG: hypothetical protein JWN82_119 [Candidatus Saccharibacteria bacterium]|nr:hypothetical protein [Candidatus Saccharibacteria bacterium]